MAVGVCAVGVVVGDVVLEVRVVEAAGDVGHAVRQVVAADPGAEAVVATGRLNGCGEGGEVGVAESVEVVCDTGADARSVARTSEVPSIQATPSLSNLRAELASAGVLVVEGASMRFSRDYLFNSPSTAAGVVLGRTANGRIEWKDEQDQTLRELSRASVEAGA